MDFAGIASVSVCAYEWSSVFRVYTGGVLAYVCRIVMHAHGTRDAELAAIDVDRTARTRFP